MVCLLFVYGIEKEIFFILQEIALVDEAIILFLDNKKFIFGSEK